MYRLRVALLCLAGIAFHAIWYGPALADSTAHGRNDFLSFYTAGKLAGTRDLYNPAKFVAAEANETGRSSEYLIFVRLPWEAALLWPLARLPFLPAYWLWQASALAALIASVFLFPTAEIEKKFIGCAWSLPVFASFAVGQDVAFVLLAIVCTLRWKGRRDGLAGACLALCAAKIHLLWMFAAVLLSRSNRKFLTGFFGCGTALAALCFAAGGSNWIPLFLRALRFCEGHEQLSVMPNLHRIFATAPLLELVCAGAVAAAVLVTARQDWKLGCATALAGGLLTGRHCFLPDCAILLPAAGLAVQRLPEYRKPLVLLLLPVVYLPVLLEQPGIPTLVFLLFVFGLCAATRTIPLPRPLTASLRP